MSDLTLYQLAAEYRGVAARLADLDLDEATVRDTLEGESGALIAKGAAVAAVALNLGAQADTVEAVAKRMMERAKALRNREAWLRDYLLGSMQVAGISEITANDGTFTAKIRNNPESVEVLDENAVPEEFTRVKTIVEIDKAKAKDAMKAGRQVEGLRLKRTQSLTIK